MSVKEKFIESIRELVLNPTDECVLYPVVNKDGYGSIRKTEGGIKKQYLAHRLSYAEANNVELNSNQVIMHSCDVPNCVNPRHLSLGTHADNSRDKVSKGRQAKGLGNGQYKHGYYSIYAPQEKPKPAFESLYSRSLTLEQVLFLKEAIRTRGDKTLSSLSKELGIKYQTLRDLNIGRIYRDV
jgi:hypothetical protein